MKKYKGILFVFLLAVLVCIGSGCGRREVTAENVLAAEETVSQSGQEEPVEEQEPQKEPEPVVSRARLTFTGDIMVHSWQYNEAYDSQTDTYNFMHNFQDMKPYFQSSDLVIGNLETVLAGREAGISDYPLFNTPDEFLDALKDAGFDVLTTANNHCMDKRKDGLLRTLDKLDEYGFAHTGTFRSQQERDTILIQEVNGMKIAFLSYTYGTNGIPVPDSYLVNLLDRELIQKDMAAAKALNPDLIVVLPHMGVEYETYARQEFQDWADFLFQEGADIVVASHPHVLQPMEMKTITEADGTTRTGFVIYSMGNFISSQTTPPRNASILLQIDLKKTGEEKPIIEQVSFVPIWTQFRGVDGQDHFVVRSVYEMLTLPESQQQALLRQKDIARLKEIHSETTSLLLNQDIPLEDIQDQYIFYQVMEWNVMK